jgi:DNA-binding PadR family transcriptional regulator
LLQVRAEGIATRNAILSGSSKAKAFKKIEDRIVKKSLDIIILKALKEKPRSGYSIILFINKKFGVKLSAGTVYSLLHSLEKKGLVKTNKQKIRYYALSEKGEETLRVIKTMENRIKELNNTIFTKSAETMRLTSKADES